jgi:DNA repair exonuclease SbcCD ATPase subunit
MTRTNEEIAREAARKVSPLNFLSEGEPDISSEESSFRYAENEAAIAEHNAVYQAILAALNEAERRDREEYGRNLEALFAKVRELEADRERLEHLMAGKCVRVIRNGEPFVSALFYSPTREEIDQARTP